MMMAGHLRPPEGPAQQQVTVLEVHCTTHFFLAASAPHGQQPLWAFPLGGCFMAVGWRSAHSVAAGQQQQDQQQQQQQHRIFLKHQQLFSSRRHCVTSSDGAA
jgi:hypothetical protein